MDTYRPLPEYLTIKPSKIEGLGLFTLSDIPEGATLGVSHVVDLETGEINRTPLGGFVNHSEKPNCKIVKVSRWWYLKTITDIKGMSELTLKYQLYNPLS